MPNDLPVPDDLMSMIEKRENKGRRKADRDEVDESDSRTDQEQRAASERRKRTRRRS